MSSLFHDSRHLHLHVMTTDLCSPSLKNKKHYNSFSPALGFWLPLEKVKGWVEGTSDSTAGSQMGDRSATGLTCKLFCPSFWTADDNSDVCISSCPAPSRSKQGDVLIYCILSLNNSTRLRQALRLPPAHYEPILKRGLLSHLTGESFATIPKLKAHLEGELRKAERKAKGGRAAGRNE